MSAMTSSRIVLIPLFQKLQLITPGNAIASPKYTELDVQKFRHILPFAEEMVLYTMGEQMSANMNWGVFFLSGFTRSQEISATPIQIGSTVTNAAPGPLRHTAYSTTSNFLIESRIFVGVGNGSGSAAESGIGSAMLAVKTVGM